MHDIDRALFEAEGDEQENPYYEGESDTYGEQETFDEGEGFDYGEGEAEEPYGEAESELDLASRVFRRSRAKTSSSSLSATGTSTRPSLAVGQALASHLKTAAGKYCRRSAKPSAATSHRGPEEPSDGGPANG